MGGFGRVGKWKPRQVWVGAGQVVRALDPQGVPVWARVSTSLASQLGQGTGIFLGITAYKVRRTTERAQIILEEKPIPLDAKQALYIYNSNDKVNVYVWVEVFEREEIPDSEGKR